MKLIDKIFSVILMLSGATLVSCNLDAEPNGEYTVDTFWASEAGCEAIMSGCYSTLTKAGLYGGATPLLEDTATPNAFNYDNTMGYNVIALGVQTAGNSAVIGARWDHAYEGIGRCNLHLSRINGSEISEERKGEMEGEAKFLRALYYYMLSTYYNDVPLITAPPAISQESLSRTAHSKIVEQIVADLDDAYELLPWSWSSSDLGRATKGAALALKMRVLLFEASPLLNVDKKSSKWQDVVDVAELLVGQAGEGGYGLYSSYRNMFLPQNEYNKESIFNVEFSLVTNTPRNSFDVLSVSYRTNSPLKDLIDSYSKDDIRKSATNFCPGDTFMGIKNATAGAISAFTGYAHRKLTIYDAQPRNAAAEGEINYMVLRYADVLLMYAEALNEVGGKTDDVYSLVGQVRKRAGLDGLTPGMTQEQLRDAIKLERRLEFAGEGLYYNDIRRWRDAEKVMNGTIKKSDGDAIVIRSFDPKRDYWWPVPEKQIKLNPNLTQNPNY